MKKETVMGIDLSYKSTGWALIDVESGKLVKYGVIVQDKDKRLCESLYNFGLELRSILKENNVICVSLEELNFSSNFNTSKSLLRIHGIAMFIIYEILKTEVVQYHNQSWKSKLGIKRPKKEITTNENGIKTKQYPAVMLGDKKCKGDIKHATLLVINKLYNLKLNYTENDISDAIGLATCLYNDIKSSE